MECNGEIDIFLDDVEVVGTMVVSPIDPRDNTWLNPTGIVETAGLAHVGDQR